MEYVITGIVFFCLGVLSGIFLICLCMAAKSVADTQQDIDDSCHGCFGAANNDCQDCPKKGGVSND